MVLFTNLKDVEIYEDKYNYQSILKLTSGIGFDLNRLNKKQLEIYNLLNKEAETNGFKIEYL